MKYLNFFTRILAYASVGVFLAGAGVYASTWRFWAILACISIIQVNEHIR